MYVYIHPHKQIAMYTYIYIYICICMYLIDLLSLGLHPKGRRSSEWPPSPSRSLVGAPPRALLFIVGWILGGSGAIIRHIRVPYISMIWYLKKV